MVPPGSFRCVRYVITSPGGLRRVPGSRRARPRLRLRLRSLTRPPSGDLGMARSDCSVAREIPPSFAGPAMYNTAPSPTRSLDEELSFDDERPPELPDPDAADREPALRAEPSGPSGPRRELLVQLSTLRRDAFSCWSFSGCRGVLWPPVVPFLYRRPEEEGPRHDGALFLVQASTVFLLPRRRGRPEPLYRDPDGSPSLHGGVCAVLPAHPSRRGDVPD